MISVGDLVEYETDNNGPIYRGRVEEIRSNGLAYVRWEDGSPLRTFMPLDILSGVASPGQAPPELRQILGEALSEKGTPE